MAKPYQADREIDEEARMTFTEHLRELRARIVRSAVALFAAFIICYIFSNGIFYIVARPLSPLKESGMLKSVNWTTLNPLEAFLVKLKLAAYGGLVVSLPFLLYQAGAFVLPGLKHNERRILWILLSGCACLAIVGVGVAYFGVFPLVLPYLLRWVPEGVEVQFRMSETVSLILKGLLGFTLAFQFPMVVLILVRAGLLSPATLRRYRGIAIVGMAVLSAFFTPPDPLSMIILMAPLALLYEVSIWLSHLVAKRQTQDESNE